LGDLAHPQRARDARRTARVTRCPSGASSTCPANRSACASVAFGRAARYGLRRCDRRGSLAALSRPGRNQGSDRVGSVPRARRNARSERRRDGQSRVASETPWRPRNQARAYRRRRCSRQSEPQPVGAPRPRPRGSSGSPRGVRLDRACAALDTSAAAGVLLKVPEEPVLACSISGNPRLPQGRSAAVSSRRRRAIPDSYASRSARRGRASSFPASAS